jgi:hypothetical protein
MHATIKAFHHPDFDALEVHVLAFVAAYNFAKHLAALRWRTPFQAICDAWRDDPSTFKIGLRHLIPGPHTYCVELDFLDRRVFVDRRSGGRYGTTFTRSRIPVAVL